MPKESLCIMVPKAYGERTIAFASKLAIIDSALEIQSDANYVYVPLTRQPSAEELAGLQSQVPDYTLKLHVFPEKKKLSYFVLLCVRVPLCFSSKVQSRHPKGGKGGERWKVERGQTKQLFIIVLLAKPISVAKRKGGSNGCHAVLLVVVNGGDDWDGASSNLREVI